MHMHLRKVKLMGDIEVTWVGLDGDCASGRRYCSTLHEGCASVFPYCTTAHGYCTSRSPYCASSPGHRASGCISQYHTVYLLVSIIYKYGQHFCSLIINGDK